MMQALIDPRFNRVCQIEPDDSTFPVANPLFWTECPPDVETEWTYENGVFAPPVPYVPTADDNKAYPCPSSTDQTNSPSC